MKRFVKIASLLIGLWTSPGLFAQTEAVARLDTNAILVGDQITFDLEFRCPADYKVLWPIITDTVTQGIEIIKHTQPGSELSSDQYERIYRQSFTITSFDSGYYVIPPIPIQYQLPDDTTGQYAETEALLLEVQTVPVNLEAEIKDIKEPWHAPFTFREALPYLLILLGAGILGFGIYYYLRKRKKAEPVFKVPAAKKIPPDKAALESLEALRYKKLWQNGEIKQYHTELTDVIREYIWQGFKIHALEFTTEEIMGAVNSVGANFQAKEKLHQTLILADLVKFAKMEPLPLEHDASLNNAIDFVRETRHLLRGEKPELQTADDHTEEVPEAAEKATLQDEDGKEVTHVE